MTTPQKAKRITKAPTMKQTLDRAPFSTLEKLLAKVAEDFVPNERLTVTESAIKYTKIGDGGGRTVNWSLRKTPYIAEPQDILVSLDHSGMIFVGPARTGKALPINTEIPTPAGWRMMGDLAVGDEVYGADGKPTKVLAVTDVMYNHQCYDVRFADGTSIIADADHLWEVRDVSVEIRLRPRVNGKKVKVSTAPMAARRVLSTQQILDAGLTYRNRSKFSIRVNKAVQRKPVDLFLDPYILGIWLGDGSKINCTITSGQHDVEDMVRNIEARGYKARVYTPSQIRKAFTIAVMGPDGVFLDQYLSTMGFDEHTPKHIPAQYMMGSEHQRRELLRGLMDTDGSIFGKAGRHVQFVTVDKLLCDQVRELASSLGYKASTRSKPSFIGKKQYRDAHLVEFIVYDGAECFSLPRKVERCCDFTATRKTQTGSRFITEIVPVETRPVRCIKVAALDSLFLAGRDHIVTHNSVMFLNWTTHTVMNDPDDMLIVHTDMKNGRKWSKGEFDRYLAASKDIRSRQMTARQFDNTFDKQFKSGMRFNLTFPTASNLSAITVGKVGFMDYDRIPDDATESSNPYDLGSVRTRTKGRRGMCAAESSPNPDKEMEDPKWRPSNPHEAPPATGIFELYNRGDRRLFMWRCIHDDCRQWFEGTFDLLKGWQEIDDITEASEAVYLECPCCGKAIPPAARDELNLHGRWVPQGGMVAPDGSIVQIPGQKMRRGKIASFWLKGPAAGYFTWNELVASYITATRAYESTQDEGPLRKWTTTDYGSYYISKARLSDRNPEDLREKAEDWGSTRELPTIPPGVRFFVVTVDVQGDGFVCQSTGFMPNGDMVVIDGFKITSSDRLDADGKNLPVDPRAFPEDWDMLYEQVFKRSYELSDGSGRRMRARMCSVDGYGQEGVTTQAYRFWLRLKELGDGSHRKFAITKGEPTPNWPIAKTSITEAGANNKHALVRGAIPRIHVGSLIAKDAVAGYMAQRVQSENDSSGGMLRYPTWMPSWFYKQMTNEIREAKGWKKIGARRNEAFDLTAYALALVMRPVEVDSPFDNIQFHRIGWDDDHNCPIWAADWDKNDHVFTPTFGDDNAPTPEKPKRLTLEELAKRLA